jgi:hypothetical protein
MIPTQELLSSVPAFQCRTCQEPLALGIGILTGAGLAFILFLLWYKIYVVNDE